MKNLIIKFLSISLFITFGSCTEDWLDINTNPNSLPTATPAFVFTNALNTSTLSVINFNEQGSYWSGQWTQSSSYILVTTTFGYQFTNGDFNYWDGIYDNLQDYQYVINTADEADQKYFKGPAKIMKAYLFQALVDMYGDIPYTDALKGVDELAPKLDNQKTVYENLITLLDEAIAETKANAFPSAFVSADIIFRGNTDKWIKFANSLKLRILIHQSRIAGRDGYIVAEINKIAAQGSGFITGEEVGVGGSAFYVATAGKLNPMYDRWAYDANGAVRALARFPRPTKFLFDVLIANDDTLRLKRIAYAKGGENPSIPGTSLAPEIIANYVGVPFGASAGIYTAQASSYIGPALFVKGQFNKPFILMTATEIQFLLAEAKERYPAVNLPGTSQSYYEEGVKQSFRLVGAPASGATAILTNGKVNSDWSASPNKLEAIAIQKWIALTNYSGLEAWTEYRRTNLPVTPQSPVVTDSKRPVRLFYPSTESGSNSNVSAVTVDVFTTKIFWDVD